MTLAQPIRRAALAAAGTVLGTMLLSAAAAAQDFAYGENLFMQNCAACHGSQGLGDGPVSGFFATRPKNLQLLASENNGAFPFSEVYQAIDGRRAVAAHGTRSMPVFGDIFEELAGPMTFHPGVDSDELVQARILALTYFLQSIQN